MIHDKQIKSVQGLELLDKVRAFSLRLPEATEGLDAFGHTSFRVKDKPFVMMGENEGQTSLSIKTLPLTQELLLQRGDFTKTHYIGHHGWVTLRQEAQVEWSEIEELILEGYLRTAPKRLVKLVQETRVTQDTPETSSSELFTLRQHQPGDMGWITHRHGVLYWQEYGWDERFEALVAQVVADFINEFKPERERCWIAEKEGEIVGSVFVVEASEEVAKLRLLLLEPKARGLGLGSRLVDECVRFAKQCGYKKMVLWTNSVLVAARHIYEKAGFQLMETEAHHSFGHDLIGETWEIDLEQ